MRKLLLLYSISATIIFAGEYDSLEPIVVSTSYPISELDDGESTIAIINKKELEQAPTGFAKDVLGEVPGVFVSSDGGAGGVTNLRIRGSSSDQVLYQINGIKLSDPTSVGGSFELGQLLLDDLEQIEVIRGPQSSLSGAVGGVVNIRTKTGIDATKVFNAVVNTGIGSNRTQKLSVGIDGRKDNLYYAIALSRYKTDGISSRSRYSVVDDKGNLAEIKATEDDAYENTTARFNFGYDYQDKIGFEVSYFNTESSADYDPFLPPDDGGDSIYTHPAYDWRQEGFKISGHLKHFDESISHRLKFTQNKTDRTYNEAGFGNKYKGQNKTIDYQINSFFDQSGAITQELIGNYSYEKSYDLESDSLISDIISNNFSTKYQLFNDRGDSFSISSNYAKNSRFNSRLTYKLATGIYLNSFFRLHASYGTGVKNPTIAELSSNYDALNGGINLSDLEQERSHGGDIGIIYESIDTRHYLDLTLFSQHYKNAITYLYDQGFDTYFNEDGTSKAIGLELGYKFQINNQLNFKLNYTFTDGEEPNGDRLDRIPYSQVFSSLSYKATPEITTRVKLNFVGSRPDRASMQMSPSYTTIDVGANYQINPKLELYGQINNVFDKNYESVYQYSQDGINFFVGLRGGF